MFRGVSRWIRPFPRAVAKTVSLQRNPGHFYTQISFMSNVEQVPPQSDEVKIDETDNMSQEETVRSMKTVLQNAGADSILILKSLIHKSISEPTAFNKSSSDILLTLISQSKDNTPELIEYVTGQEDCPNKYNALVQLYMNSGKFRDAFDVIHMSITNNMELNSSLIELYLYRLIMRRNLTVAISLMKTLQGKNFSLSSQILSLFASKAIQSCHHGACKYAAHRIILKSRAYYNEKTILKLTQIISKRGEFPIILDLLKYYGNNCTISDEMSIQMFICLMESTSTKVTLEEAIQKFEYLQKEYLDKLLRDPRELYFKVIDLPNFQKLVNDTIKNAPIISISNFVETCQNRRLVYPHVLSALAELGRGEEAFALFKMLSGLNIEQDSECFSYLFRGAKVLNNHNLMKRILEYKIEENEDVVLDRKTHVLISQCLANSSEASFWEEYLVNLVDGEGQCNPR